MSDLETFLRELFLAAIPALSAMALAFYRAHASADAQSKYGAIVQQMAGNLAGVLKVAVDAGTIALSDVHPESPAVLNLVRLMSTTLSATLAKLGTNPEALAHMIVGKFAALVGSEATVTTGSIPLDPPGSVAPGIYDVPPPPIDGDPVALALGATATPHARVEGLGHFLVVRIPLGARSTRRAV